MWKETIKTKDCELLLDASQTIVTITVIKVIILVVMMMNTMKMKKMVT
jgi:hypothetical protein